MKKNCKKGNGLSTSSGADADINQIGVVLLSTPFRGNVLYFVQKLQASILLNFNGLEIP